MEDIHRKVLTKARVYLVKNLDLEMGESTLVDHLIEEGSLSSTDEERIKTLSSKGDKIRYFLKEYDRRGPNAYDALLECLLHTQPYIRSHLINIENGLRAGKKLPERSFESHRIQDAQEERHGNLGGIDDPDAKLGEVNAAAIGHTMIPYSYAEEDVYRVDSEPRGHCLIINNYNVLGQTPRAGSQKDVDNLKTLFEQFGYHVDVNERDLTAMEMKNRISDFVQMKAWRDVHACILVVMSHGTESAVYGSDGNTVLINELLHYFSNEISPGLEGKPKLVLLQACRGALRDSGTHRDATDTNLETNEEAVSVNNDILQDKFIKVYRSLPTVSDLIVGFPTLPGFVSWRSVENGSWYMNAICQIFRKYGAHEHIFDLLIRVNGAVAGMEAGNKQMPQPQSMIVKKFFLSTKNLNISG